MPQFAPLLRKDHQPVRYLVVDDSVFARKNIMKMIEIFGGVVAGAGVELARRGVQRCLLAGEVVRGTGVEQAGLLLVRGIGETGLERTLIAGDIGHARLKQRLGHGQNAFAAEFAAGPEAQLLDLFLERAFRHPRPYAFPCAPMRN